MSNKSQQPKEREGVISALNVAIEGMNLAKEISSITPAKAVFSSVNVVLTMIKDTMINQVDYVELGLACADVCKVLDRGLEGRSLDDLNNSVLEAISQLKTAVAEIRARIIKQGKRNVVSRHLHAKYDKEKIAAWRLDLVRILHVFNTELAINIHTTVSDTRVMVSDIHRTMVRGQETSGGKDTSTGTCTLGESPPPPPRTFFGRDELIEKTVDLAEGLDPIALLGAGGIGKTSIALAVLHHDRIKQRFGDDRRFIRCDQFPASRVHLLRRLSVVTGAGIENPEELTPLRTFLSSRKMLIVLDNAESILDPRGTDAQEIYAVVEELSRFDNICICITSRISTIPPGFEHLDVPTLSIEAALKTFYRIYNSNDRSNVVDGILEQLDFHPLSITLLATVAQENKWSTSRLAREWEEGRTSVLQTQHSNSLAAAIELSLASPMFQELGPSAREFLGVIAFFPQGVSEDNADWFFPAISNATNLLDGFCILSLTHRSNGFVTMLAPLRDHLRPEDPKSAPLLCATRDHYFSRMSVAINPDNPSFRESQWIILEDVNVEHLLDVFTTIDATSDGVWDACADFLRHLNWHKHRLTILGSKIEGLPDDHCSKPNCLSQLSELSSAVGDYVEQQRLLTHTLKLWRERGEDNQVALILVSLSDANRLLDLPKEGIEQAKEALGIYERLGDTWGQVDCLIGLAYILHHDQQLDAAEEAASRSIGLVSEKGNQTLVCGSHRVLGEIYESKGETEKAIHHFEIALGIASSLNWHNGLFSVHCSLAWLFLGQGRFDDAHAHVKQAKSHTDHSAYQLGRAMELQAHIWYRQRKFEEAKSEALCAIDVHEKLGAAKDVEVCKKILREVQKELNTPLSSQGTGRWSRWLR